MNKQKEYKGGWLWISWICFATSSALITADPLSRAGAWHTWKIVSYISFAFVTITLIGWIRGRRRNR